MLFLGLWKKGNNGVEAPVIKGGMTIDTAQICRTDAIPEFLTFLDNEYPDQVQRWLMRKNYAKDDPSSTIKAVQQSFSDTEMKKSINKVVTIQSGSDPDKKYQVRFSMTGRMSCTCPGFGFRGRCRHLGEAQVKLHANPKAYDEEVVIDAPPEEADE